ncbi:MAG TPA: SIMPL domain-containing protein [Thermoanaerobaculia bacterium]
MKRFLPTLALTLATTAALAQSAAAQSPAPRDVAMPETISVTGSGRTSLTPDRFSFSVGVQTIAPTVEAAVNENNTRVQNVIAALKKAGATDRDIRTSNFSIYPQQDYREQQQGRLPQILGYQVSNNITVTSKDVTVAGRWLQLAVSSGVNTSSGIQFEVSDPAAGRDTGMRAAYNDARAKATLLAQAAGRTLGRALSITEGSQPNYMPPPGVRGSYAKAEAMAVTDVPIESGATELTFTVSVVFELR